ncbi:alpha/beta fold hydrolase, partial [Actinomadura roseirufa]|uniref:alpha/beta fold hydrolase n=1 Tax=Actinomadura roseirufa TaxID=2094049 RepID=UPI0013F14C1E
MIWRRGRDTRPWRAAVPRTAALVCSAVLALAGAAGFATADRGIERRSVTVDGVPLEVVRPARATGRLPGVVVAHGLGAGGRFMRGFADTLARRGLAVELVDLTGHGANTRRLPGDGEGPAAEARLGRDLDVAVTHLGALSWVDGRRIGLLGHSMGAAAVLRYAAAHPSVRATVAISQGAAPAAVSASAPRDLLLLAGGLEFPGYHAGAVDALRVAYPGGRTGVTYGSAGAGTARRAVLVPGVEHAGVLFSPRTHREAATWFSAALTTGSGEPSATGPAAVPDPRGHGVGGRSGRSGGPGAGAGEGRVGIRPFQRIGAAVLMHLAAVLCFGAIASVALGRPRSPGPARRVRAPVALGVPVAAVVVALPVMAALPRHWLPLAVAGPLAGFLGAAGAVLLAAARGRAAPDG